VPARLRPGDIFEAQLENAKARFFQYVGNDATQLQSNVVRVFAKEYASDVSAEVVDPSRDETQFVAHVMLNLGIKHKFWKRVGHASYVEPAEVLFRDSSDYGNPEVKISRNWWIWKMNAPQVFVGPLTGRYRDAEIGIVVPPDSLVHRMRTGRYDFVYPQFE
jgi:hypothetical protein